MNASKELLQGMMKVIMNKHTLAFLGEDTEDPELLIKKMWAKEIVQHWLIQKTREKLPVLLTNYEGDPLEFYTVTFPLRAPIRTVVDLIDQLPNFIARDDLEDTPHGWIWEFKEAKKTPKKQPTQKQDPRPTRRIDSQIGDETGTWIRYKGELKIKKKTLIIDVNSEKRAIDAETFFKKHLGFALGAPTRTKLDHPSASNEKSPGNNDLDISPEEQEKLMRDMIHQHYMNWLDSPLPILKNKTPRQAMKTKNGRNDVTNLLKDMQNQELRAVKSGHRAQPYNFDWMFAELGVDQRLL